METPLSTSFPSTRERSRRPSYTRASSRASTEAASDTRMSTQTSDRSVSNLTPSPQPPLHNSQQPAQYTSHLVHRFQNGAAKRASPAPSSSTESSRFRPPYSSTEELKTSDSRPSLTASSSYLQEKLLKERKVESDRCSSRLSNDKMSSSMDLRATQSSPARAAFDISRPKSSTGHLDGGKKKGVGLKEMEQTLTTLHKQNFDLKLELYHRREKQTSLEERCETLESEKRELEDINDKLMSELEMRDKAVEEAVAMIVSLEARMEELLREREIFRQAEKDRFFATDASLRQALSSALQNAAADPTSFDETLRTKPNADDIHSINRMPSFISERSELTENLRNVYLGVRGGSLISLPRMSEDNLDIDPRDAANRIASPTLSVLSESSFLSIYGKKKEMPSITSASAPPQRPMSPVATVPDIPRSVADPLLDIENSKGSAASVVAHALATTAPPPTAAGNSSRSSASKTSTPTKKRSTSISRMNNGSANFHPLSEFLGTNSPLQRLEKMERSLQAMNDASRPGSQEDIGEIESLARHLRSQEFGKTYAKQEKKDALRRVRTDAPFAGSLNNAHNLPPTPDTISTSTLRRYKNSNDTLSQDKETANDRSYLALSEATTSRSSSGEKRLSALESFVDNLPVTHPPSTTAFDSRRHETSGRPSYFDNHLDIPRRPRSADETTISHHGRGSGWGDSESSDDDMDIDGNDSASLHDYWLRESLRPTGQPPAPTHRSRGRKNGRVSPDLFRFPTTSNGWATTAMFGHLGGQGYHGSMSGGAGSAPLAQALDALGDSLPTPAAGLFGSNGGLLASPMPYGVSGIPSGPPPPPHRRSSLHAQTGPSSRSGSRHGTAPGTPSLGSSALPNSKSSRRSPTRTGTAGGSGSAAMSRSNSQDTNRPQSQSAPSQPEQTALPKQRHYPPASGSNATSRSRVMSLFRRSGSHEPNSAAAAATASAPSSAPPTETTFAAAAAAKKNAEMPAIGVPSRIRQSDLDDENAGVSSTPPPILRNPRNPIRGSVDSSSGLREIVSQTAPANENATADPATTPSLPPPATKEAGAVPNLATPASAAAPTAQGAQASLQMQPLDASGGAPRKKWLGLGRVTSGMRTRTG